MGFNHGIFHPHSNWPSRWGQISPEFIAYALQQWLRDQQCQTLYITPGSPWENPFIESFNGTLRGECLNRWVFADGAEAQQIIEAWRQRYNQQRPHSSLGYLPPAVFEWFSMFVNQRVYSNS